MPESPELLAEVHGLRERVDDLSVMMEMLVRALSAERRAELLERLRGDEALRRILLLVDGQRAQGEILTELKAAGVRGASAASVSRKLEQLADDMQLVELDGRTAKGKVYRRSRADRILVISRELQR